MQLVWACSLSPRHVTGMICMVQANVGYNPSHANNDLSLSLSARSPLNLFSFLISFLYCSLSLSLCLPFNSFYLTQLSFIRNNFKNRKMIEADWRISMLSSLSLFQFYGTNNKQRLSFFNIRLHKQANTHRQTFESTWVCVCV